MTKGAYVKAWARTYPPSLSLTRSCSRPRFLQPGSGFGLCPRQRGGLRRQEGRRGVRRAVVPRVLGGSGSSGTRTCLEAA